MEGEEAEEAHERAVLAVHDRMVRAAAG